MRHFGVLCPAATGHLNPMTALARALLRRGHRVTFFQVPDAEAAVRKAGLDCAVIGEKLFPPGSIPKTYAELGKLGGLAGLRFTIDWLLLRAAEVVFNEGPSAIRSAGVDALLIDQTSLAGSTVAEHLGLPFVSAACALMVNEEVGVPPFSTPWAYRTAWPFRLRNRLFYALIRRLIRKVRDRQAAQREQWNLPPFRHFNDTFSKVAQVAQQPAEFEFPRRELPPTFHFTGPFVDPAARPAVPFPYEKLDGRPLVYASLGTLQNRSFPIFRAIAAACADLPVQLVLALGGGSDPAELGPLPGSPVVVEYAPQLDLIRKAELVVTHAGLNTALESLAEGVPMVAIPITNDQPGVAARLVWTGCGLMVTPKRLTVPRLRRAVERVLREGSFRENAQRLQAGIARVGSGPELAATVIEKAVNPA